MMSRKLITVISISVLTVASAFAQEEKDKGSFSAGFETNTTYYFFDEKTGAEVPDGRFGSNNYLKMDYTKGGFSAGLQLEGYFPSLVGYFPMNMTGENFMRYDFYAGFADKGWDVRIGSLYDQFGSGILYRTYEDRTLGINTALQGIRVGYTFGNYLNIKAIYGRVRDIKDYSTSNSVVAGADLSFSLSRVFNWEKFDFALEGSVIDKYEPLSESMDPSYSSHSTGYSGRLIMGYEGFQLKGEYVDRQSDPGFYNMMNNGRSQAIQVDLGYSGYGFGGLLTFRKLDNPFFQGLRDASEMYTYINYVPALTQQHTYMLATLDPYSVQTNEIGGQADLYYNFKRGTVMGGKKGMKIHANFSTYYDASKTASDAGMEVEGGSNLLFQDLTVDVERWFGNNFKMILFYTWQKLDHYRSYITDSHAIVVDMTYKFNRKHSLRWELQHLFGDKEHSSGNWAAALLEYNFAPKWSISVQDMWNYGNSDANNQNHYISGSVSYSYGKVRAALNAGRFRAGMQCSGGVCRMTPAYTGINLSLIVTL